MAGVLRMNATLGSHAPDTRVTHRQGRRRRWHAVGARVNERATSGTDRVMARAAVEEPGRPRGSTFPFDTVDSASAEDRRRPVAALA